jgi:3-deoxy-D-manno-octulosonic-acid transferase
MQSQQDAERLLALGASPDRVVVGGNLKYDVGCPRALPVVGWLERELERGQRRPLIVAGSIVAGEEELVLQAFDLVHRQWPRALLALAPRKPERFETAARIAEGFDRNVVRRSALVLDGSSPSRFDDSASVFLLDGVGELAGLYQLADVVFVGGSLAPAGGHNLLEPASFAKPPVFGPYVDNFREMASAFLKSGAAIQVNSAEELGRAWIGLLQDAPRRERMGRAARELLDRNRGATEQALERLTSILVASPRPGPQTQE